MATWPDGSLKWTGHALAPDAPSADFYEIVPGKPSLPSKPVRVEKTAELLEHGGPQYVRPDVALAGGISHCKKLAAIAESYHCAVVTHNFLGPLGTAASVHLDASIPNFITQEYSKKDEGEHNAVYKCSYKREGGYILLPEAPGLGVELDDDKIADTPFTPITNTNTLLRNDGSVAYAV